MKENFNPNSTHLLLNFKLFLPIILIFHPISSVYLNQGNHQLISNFTFGSCFSGFLAEKLDIFNQISKEQSQLFLWTGDATYLDTAWMSAFNHFINTNYFNELHALKMYNITYNNPYYSIIRSEIPVIGIWDDHDFGVNNGDKHYKHKDITKQLFLNFLDEPSDSNRRQGGAIYASYSFGQDSRSFKIILLDTRYNKEFYLNPESDILGEDQWIWLEDQLKSTEAFTFIVSGTPILPINRLAHDNFYQKSRIRLFEIIKKSGVVFISGDVHMAEISSTWCAHPSIGYVLHELVSSGLSHFYEHWFPQFVLSHVYPSTYSVGVFHGFNYGLIKFDWKENKEDNREIESNYLDSSFVFEAKDDNGVTQLSKRIFLKDLQYKPYDNEKCKLELERRFKSLSEYFLYYLASPYELLFLFLGIFLMGLNFTLPVVIIIFIYFAIRLFIKLIRYCNKYSNYRKNVVKEHIKLN